MKSRGSPLDRLQGAFLLRTRTINTSMYNLIDTTTVLPVSIADAKQHLRVDDDLDDYQIESLIYTALDYVETQANVDILRRTWELVLPRFPSALKLRCPLVSVTSIKYYDGSNTQQTLDASTYRVHSPYRVQGFVCPTTYWPATYPREDAVVVRFVSGGTVPPQARHAILLLVGAWYQNRQAEVMGTTSELKLGVDRLVNQITVLEVL